MHPVAAELPTDVRYTVSNGAQSPRRDSNQKLQEGSDSNPNERTEPQSVSLRGVQPQTEGAAARKDGTTAVAWAVDSTATITQRGPAVPGRDAFAAASKAAKGAKGAAEGGAERLEFELQEDLSVWAEDVADKAGTAAATAARAHIHAALVDGKAVDGDGGTKQKGGVQKKRQRGRRWSDSGGCKRMGGGGSRVRYKRLPADTHKHGYGEEEGRDCSSDGHASPGVDCKLVLMVS